MADSSLGGETANAVFADRASALGLVCGCADHERDLCVTFIPQPLGDLQRVDLVIAAPGQLVADLVQLPMVAAAKRDCELVTDFEAYGPGLSKPQMIDGGPMAGARRPDMAARPRTSDAPCNEGVWARRSLERFYQSGQVTDRIGAGRWKHLPKAAASVQTGCLELAWGTLTQVSQEFDGAAVVGRWPWDWGRCRPGESRGGAGRPLQSAVGGRGFAKRGGPGCLDPGLPQLTYGIDDTILWYKGRFLWA
jgi:hypothetical protein